MGADSEPTIVLEARHRDPFGGPAARVEPVRPPSWLTTPGPKFLEQPDNMAYGQTHTGYFPVDKKALNDPTDQAWVQQYPLFTAAIDQLHATRLDKAT